jgi:hypothetical protein
MAARKGVNPIHCSFPFIASIGLHRCLRRLNPFGQADTKRGQPYTLFISFHSINRLASLPQTT